MRETRLFDSHTRLWWKTYQRQYFSRFSGDYCDSSHKVWVGRDFFHSYTVSSLYRKHHRSVARDVFSSAIFLRWLQYIPSTYRVE